MADNNKQRLLLAANCNVEPVVLKALERITGKDVELDYIDTIYNKGTNTFKRHCSYLKIAWKVFKKRNHYATLLFWQQFIGLYYILFASLSFSRKFPPAIILTFIFIKRQGLVGRLHKALYQKAVDSSSVLKLVCHSSLEKNYYSEEFGNKSANKFEFVPIGEGTYLFDPVINELGPFFFSGGTSNRDYKTLIDAFRGLEEKLIVACRPSDVDGIQIPENVKVRFDVYGDEFLLFQQKAKALILAIDDPLVSAGQLVLLNSMRSGKLSIVTAGPCMDDYAEDSFTLKVEAKNSEAIRKAILFVNENPKKVKEMELSALERYKENYSLERYGEKVATLLTTLI